MAIDESTPAADHPVNSHATPPQDAATVAELRAEVAALRAEVAHLRAQIPTSRNTPAAEGPQNTSGGALRSRRAVLLGGLGAGVAGVSALAAAGPAAAAVGTMQYGAANDAGGSQTSLTSLASRTLVVTSTGANGTGLRASGSLFGVNASTANGIASFGEAGSGFGVYGNAGTGVGVYAGSESGPPLFLASARSAVPTSGNWNAGALLMTSTGELWICVQTGTPGRWRLLGGPSSAGAYTPIEPIRAYDSRFNMAPDASGPLGAGANREFSIRNSRNPSTGAVIAANVIPLNSTALTINLTVTQTQNSGHLRLAAGGTATTPNTSAINWQSAGVTLANGLTVPASANGRLKVWCQGGPTQFMVDITGYFRSA
ncbi:MAG: hypothetical protein H6525_12330 [Actinobacteria bacterium]|nr:hypothetical protein [Actinomycetota bacterium]